jgi:predicted GTPase
MTIVVNIAFFNIIFYTVVSRINQNSNFVFCKNYVDKDNTIEVPRRSRSQSKKYRCFNSREKLVVITGLSGSGKSSSHLILFMPKDRY